MNRRTILAGALATLGARAAAGASQPAVPFDAQIAAMETQLGGRIGVAALNTADGARLAHRASERFAMASTFKWTLAAFVLSRIDAGKLQADQQIAYGRTDILPHSPTTEAHLSEGYLTVLQLAEAGVEVSDNGAANLLLTRCGGPAALTQFLRSTGDRATRLDRMELNLNSNLPGDPRDTTTPNAMVSTMQTILLGNILAPASRELLLTWLKNSQTGQQRLRAGLPRSWIVGDKTGTGENGAINDYAIAWPPGAQSPLLIVCLMSGSPKSIDDLSAAHARIASLVAVALG
jgi:beta-lactamase class A